MYPRRFSYIRAGSADDAVAQLAEHGPDASVLAGGMSLVPLMKYRERTPPVLIDIGRLRELAGVTVADDAVRIGATTRHHELAVWRGDDERLAMVGELAASIGDPQVRNMGTIGGSLAAVEPTGDWCAALLATRGRVVARSARGQRTIAADELFVDVRRSALEDDELICEVALPLPAGARHGTAHVKFEVRAAAAPLMACAASITLDDDGTIAQAGIGCIGLDAMPIRLHAAERALAGVAAGGDGTAAAPAIAAGAVREPHPGFRGSVMATLVADAARRACARACGATTTTTAP